MFLPLSQSCREFRCISTLSPFWISIHHNAASFSFFASELPAANMSANTKTHPELLHFSPKSFFNVLFPGKSAKDNPEFKKICAVAEARLPLTCHVPPSCRSQYAIDGSVSAMCSNDVHCNKKVLGSDPYLKCGKCHFEVYCSKKCLSQHASVHSTRCTGTATHSVKRIYADLVDMLDQYFSPREKLLKSGLPKFHFFTPLSARSVSDAKKKQRLLAIDTWLSLQILKEASSTFPKAEGTGALLCMHCRKETAATPNAINAIVFTPEDLKSNINIEDTQALGECFEQVDIEFLGIKCNTMIEIRTRICCSQRCHSNYNSLIDPIACCEIWPELLTGNLNMLIEYIGAN